MRDEKIESILSGNLRAVSQVGVEGRGLVKIVFIV
jgi:hypothetical protein